MRKFKVVKDRNNHGFKIGEKLTLINEKDGKYEDSYGIFRWLDDDEVKEIKPKLTEKRIREIIQEELKAKPVPFINWDYGCDTVTELKPKEEPKPKSGWYKFNKRKKYLVYLDLENNTRYGFNTDGLWFECKNSNANTYRFTPADPKEVEQRLIEEAKKRGFKEGVSSRCVITNTKMEVKDFYYYNPTHKPDADQLAFFAEDLEGQDESVIILYKKGKWATIIENTVTINGYQMKQDGGIISFGRAKFNKHFFINILSTVNQCNGGANDLGIKHRGIEIDNNRKIKSITLSYDVTITIQELERIVKAIK